MQFDMNKRLSSTWEKVDTGYSSSTVIDDAILLLFPPSYQASQSLVAK